MITKINIKFMKWRLKYMRRAFTKKDLFNCKNNSTDIKAILDRALEYVASSSYEAVIKMDGKEEEKTLIAIVAYDPDTEEFIYIASPSSTLIDSIYDLVDYASDCEENESVIFTIVTRKSKAGREFYTCELL